MAAVQMVMMAAAPVVTPSAIVDNFNRSDGAIGTASDGVAWTVLSSGLLVSSNKLTGSGAVVRNLGVDATSWSVKLKSDGANFPYLMLRGDGTANNFVGVGIASDHSIRLFTFIAGSFAGVAASAGGDFTAGTEHTLLVTRSGDTFTFKVDGADPPVIGPFQGTTSQFAGNTYFGITMGGGTDTIDDVNVS